jgi:large subunit ribosomal protein L21e
MLLRKRIRDRGKAKLSKYFKELNQGDKVSIIKDFSNTFPYPKRIQGSTGEVVGKRGEAYVIKFNEGKKEKTIILKAIHLKKLNNKVIQKEKPGKK